MLSTNNQPVAPQIKSNKVAETKGEDRTSQLTKVIIMEQLEKLSSQAQHSFESDIYYDTRGLRQFFLKADLQAIKTDLVELQQIYRMVGLRGMNEKLQNVIDQLALTNYNKEDVVDLLMALAREVESQLDKMDEQNNATRPKNTEEKVALYAKLHFEMRELKDQMRPIIEKVRLEGDHPIMGDFTEDSKVFQLQENIRGNGGSYFAVKGAEYVYVVKPVDEDVGAFNNRKGIVDLCPIFEDLESNYLSIYRAPVNDMMMYDLASLIGISENVPETAMMIVENDSFYDAFKHADEETKQMAIAAGAGPDMEKLCTVQRFVPNSKPVVEVYHELLAQNTDLQDATSCIDQADFENVNILMWTSFEADGHMGNILATVKGIDENGQQIYGLVKIDSSFSFPNLNFAPGNALAFFPNADQQLSQRAQDLIANIDTAAILNRMKELGYTPGHIDAMEARIVTLQNLATQSLSIYAINAQMQTAPNKVENKTTVLAV